MIKFERKTIQSMQFALGLAGFGYLSIVAGLVWTFANYLGFVALFLSALLLLARKTDIARLRGVYDGLKERVA